MNEFSTTNPRAATEVVVRQNKRTQSPIHAEPIQ